MELCTIDQEVSVAKLYGSTSILKNLEENIDKL